MMEIEISTPPALNPAREREADLHSLFNILNIISLHLLELRFDFPQYESSFTGLIDEIADLADEFRKTDDLSILINKLRRTKPAVFNLLSTLSGSADSDKERSLVAEASENAESIFRILTVRIDELEFRLEDPDKRIKLHKDKLLEDMSDVLDAIEKNAKGRYFIRYNLALKEEQDYYIDLKVDTVDPEGFLTIPLRLKDVMRDLLANARKYTIPGGKIAMAIHQNFEQIDCIVEDSGCGIPADEIEKVCEFGYRATNVRHRPTMGGGFGLTKAVSLVLRWGGRFRITSVENQGTRIRITLPYRPITNVI